MEKETLKKELETLKSLRDIANLPAVKLLILSSKDKVMNTVSLLANTYTDKSEIEVKSLCATLKANLDIYQLMTGVQNQIESIEEVLSGENIKNE